MTKDEARTYIKDQLPDYLKNMGIDISKPFKCLNPNHTDEHPSMRYTEKNGKKMCHCFACGVTMDTIDVVAKQKGLNFGQAFDYLCDYYGIEVTNKGTNLSKPDPKKQTYNARKIRAARNASTQELAPYFEDCANNIEKCDYLVKRGISFETQKRFNIGYDEQRNKIIIPTSYCTYTSRSIKPDVDKADRYRKEGKEISMFADRNAIKSPDNPIFVVEGEIDALTLYEVGETAMALGTTAKVGDFLKWADKARPEKPFILMMDSDEAGRVCSNQIAKGLDELGIAYTVSSNYWIGKDPNEAYMNDKEWFKESIANEREKAEELYRANERIETIREAESGLEL